MKQYLRHPRTIFLLSLLLVSIILIHPLKALFDKWIVEDILNAVNSSLLNDIVLLILTATVSWKIIDDALKKKLKSNDWGLISIALILVYVIVRIQNTYYIYTSFTLFPCVKYADTFILPLFLFLIVKVLQHRKKPDLCKYHDKPFLVDVPLSDKSKDELNRKKFAERIAKKIQSKLPIVNSGSLAIGITGEWGAGKSSFNNMVKASLDTESRIIIDFNPWRSASPTKIIEDFFGLLISELKPYDHNLSDNIYNYAKTLTKIDENFITKAAQTIGEIFDSSNKNELYESINNSITDVKRQIIVFIDDLDRLDKKEITEVLRIIRNTANFNNVVYVVAYDKNYVLEAVKSFNESNYHSFLEKIFQFEFTLPFYRSEVIRKYLIEKLQSGLPEGMHKEIELVIESRVNGINIVNELIYNHRSAIRLANAIIFEIEDVMHEVLFYDFYLLQVFKLKYPTVFNLLFENSTLFLIPEQREQEVYYRLRTESEKTKMLDEIQKRHVMDSFLNGDNKGSEDKKEDTPLLFLTLLESNATQYNLKPSDINIIRHILSELLNQNRETLKGYKNQRYKAFVKSENFHKYFAFQLEEGEISALDFETARRQSFPEYLEKIRSWKEAGNLRAFLDRIYKIEDFVTVEEFENQIRALWYIGRNYAAESNLYGFDFAFLVNTLFYPRIDGAKEIKLYGDIATYKAFLNTLFEQAPWPRSFENRLITMMLAKVDHFPLGHEELAAIALNNLQGHIDQDLGLTSAFWDTLHNTKVWQKEEYRSVGNPKGRDIARAYYRKKLTACDLGSFIRQAQPESEYYFMDKSRIDFGFGSWSDFQDWFETAENIDRESDCYKEFREFYDSNMPTLPKGIIWEFKYIKPDRWK